MISLREFRSAYRNYRQNAEAIKQDDLMRTPIAGSFSPDFNLNTQLMQGMERLRDNLNVLGVGTNVVDRLDVHTGETGNRLAIVVFDGHEQTATPRIIRALGKDARGFSRHARNWPVEVVSVSAMQESTDQPIVSASMARIPIPPELRDQAQRQQAGKLLKSRTVQKEAA